jgi:hypothetical protein
MAPMDTAPNFIGTLRIILGTDLEKILSTRLNRMDELDALVTLHQEFGGEPVRHVIEDALATYRDQAGKLRHYKKPSAIETLKYWRRAARVDAEVAELQSKLQRLPSTHTGKEQVP